MLRRIQPDVAVGRAALLRFVVAAAVGALLVLHCAGCGDDAPQPLANKPSAATESAIAATIPSEPATIPEEPTRAEIEAFADCPKIEWASLPVAAEASQSITSAGGEVKLDDGTRMQIPVGALDSEQVIILRARQSEPGGPSATIFEIDAGQMSLKQDAVLTLPCPVPRPDIAKFSDGFRVQHDHDGVLNDVPAKYDPATHTVEVRLRTFSHVVVTPNVPNDTLESRIVDWAKEKFANGGDVKPIIVPHYWQHLSSWCWASSAQMMLKAYGKNVEVWELARWNDSSYMGALSAGLGDFWQVQGSATDMFTDRGLTVEHFKIPWSNLFEEFNYVVEQLRLGRPVMLTIGNFHVVNIVGCDENGVSVNDPSGVLSEIITFIKTGRDSPASTEKLVAISVPWTDLMLALQPTSMLHRQRKGGMRLGMSWTTVVTSPLPQRPAVTVQLVANGLILEHPRHSPRGGRPNAYFTWDGQVENGYRYCVACGGDDPKAGCAHQSPDRDAQHVRPLHASMSDKIYLWVYVSNAGESAASVDVSATLGGKPLGTRLWNGSLEGRTTNSLVPCAHSFPVRSLGLTPGTYDLVVQANANGTFADDFMIQLPIGPSKVVGLELSAAEDRDTLLTWNAVPEIDVEYDVYHVHTRLDYEPFLVTSTTETQFKIKAEPLGISNKSSWWYVVARHVPTNLQGPPSDYAEYVGVNDSRPYLLRSENRDNSTVVEFRSHALPKLEDGGYLQFVLYTAPSGNGPWNKQSVMDVSKKEGALSGGQMGKVTGVDRAEVIDTHAATAQVRTPPFYKVVLVERQPDGKEKEIESQVLGPGSERYIIARVVEPAKSGRGPERVRLADNSDLEYELPGDALASESREPTWPTLRMSMSMAMPDQAYMHPGTHFTVNWIGKTYHFWSGAAHTYDSSSYLGKTMEVELPMQLGSAAMQISAVADDKSTAMRTITIVCNSPEAANRKEAAAKSVEDDPKVKDLAARAESAPRRIAMLETELAAEKNEARMRELQQEILRLEELLAELEHERVNASRRLAMQSAMACEWDRAVALYNQVVRQQPAADARYAKLNQKSSDLGLLYTSGSKEQIAQQDARYIKKFRDVALEQRMLDHSRLMELATRAGDFVTVRYCALTLMSEIPTIPKDFEGQRFEVEPIARKLADATAMLTGDQQVAASWLSRAGVTNDLPHWMPVTRAENFPLRSLADELQSAEKVWREQTETTPPASSP